MLLNGIIEYLSRKSDSNQIEHLLNKLATTAPATVQ
jgi:hypothetical protein